jgi:predicted O-methyltransferase YrrM
MYLASLVPQREEVLQEMEAYAARNDFPIIGPVCGHFCYQLARMIGARSVFELGSGFGYSTAWFAKAVRETCTGAGQGILHHTVWDERLSGMARGYLARLGLVDLVRFHAAGALETLESTAGPFDVIFNDIDKQDYPASLPLIKERLRPGGLLIIDNMLWGGRIFDRKDRSPATEGVREFTRRITADHDWIVTLAPLRDGMIVAYKR